MKITSTLLVVATIMTSSLMAQEAEELQVQVTNDPLLVKEDGVAADVLRSTQVQAANGSQIVTFNEPVELVDISFAPLPPITSRLTGVCRIRLLINEVPLKIAGYSIVGTLGLSTPSQDKTGGSRIDAPVETVRLEHWGYGASMVPDAVIELTPNDVIRIETVSLPKELDCTADFVIVAKALKP
jgi:hypothetical protein